MVAAAAGNGVRARGFAVVTAVLALFLAAAAAPTPLYALYAARWSFSTTHLTAVFAVYAFALLATLLLAGSLSDDVGRRPVIAAGLVLQGASMATFLAADGLALLYAARVLQGVATGLVTAAVAAALLDLQPAPGRGALVNAVTPTFALGAGALGAGALVQHAPAPTRLVWVVLLVGAGLLLLALRLVPEPVPGHRAPRLSVRVGLEPAVRPAFLSVLPCLVATWALGGLYLSLGPSVAYLLESSSNRLVGGSVVALLAGTGGIASLAAHRWPPLRAVLTGCTALAAGAAVSVTALALSSPAMFYVGSVIAGAGFGAGFLGAFRSVAALATPARRGELATAVYIAAYLAFSVPAIIAGLLTTTAGLRATTIGYGVVVGALALAAIPATRRALSAR